MWYFYREITLFNAHPSIYSFCIFLILTHIKNHSLKQICSLNFVFHLQVNADRPVTDYAISRLCEAARDPVRVHLSFEDVAVTGHFQMGVAAVVCVALLHSAGAPVLKMERNSRDRSLPGSPIPSIPSLVLQPTERQSTVICWPLLRASIHLSPSYKLMEQDRLMRHLLDGTKQQLRAPTK